MSVIERERVEEKTVTKADVLHRAADLLEEFGWCRSVSARTATGEGTSVCAQDAVQFCMLGAVHRAALDLGLDWPRPKGWKDWPPYKARDYLGLGWTFNDDPGRTKAEVVAKLREEAERSQ
jgi:hypothetical protein